MILLDIGFGIVLIMLLALPVTHYPVTTAMFVSIILVLLYSTVHDIII